MSAAGQRARQFVAGVAALGVGAALGRSDGPSATRLALAVVAIVAVAVAFVGREPPRALWGTPQSGGFLLLLLAGVIVLAVGNPRTEDISRYDQLVAAALAATSLIVAVRLTMERRKKPVAVVLLLVYAALIVVNAGVARLFAVDMASWARGAFVVAAMPLGATGAWLLPKVRARQLVAVVLALCAGITIYYLALFRGGHSLYEIRSSYQDSFFRTGGTYAAAMLATLAFPFVLARTRWRPAFVILFAVGLAGVAAALARTFWVTTPASVLVVAAGLRGHRFGRKAVLGLSVVVAASLLVSGTGPGQQYAGLVRERITQRDLSGSFRAEEAQGLLGTMVADPTTLILGAGLGNTFSFHSTDRYAIGGVGTVSRDYSHNWYLEVLWTTGITGLAVIVLLIVTLVTMLLRALRRPDDGGDGEHWDRFLAAGLLGTLTNFALAAVTYHPFGILLWNLVLGSLIGVAVSISAAREGNAGPTVAVGKRSRW